MLINGVELPSGLFGSSVRRLYEGLLEEERPTVEGRELVTLGDLRIRTQTKKLVPFVPNDVQAPYLDVICPTWRDGRYTIRGLQEFILKARQEGLSTLIEALFFLDTVNNENTTTVIVSQDDRSTAKLFRMVQTFYEHLPPAKRPETKYASKEEFYWPSLNSSLYIGTAGSRSFGRGDAINNLHCSEAAFWLKPDDVMTGLLPAVPEDGNVFIESTANGVGNWFHTEYVAAEQGRSSFIARFFAWFLHDKYRLDPERSAPFTLTGDIAKERVLRETYGLDDWQLAWRREKIRQPGMRDKFDQEYPANSRVAFLSSGRPYFNREKLELINQSLEHLSDPLESPVGIERFPRLRRLVDAGELEVYVQPTGGAEYAIGADVSEGLSDDGEHDFDSADVAEITTREQVAHLHGQWEPHEFALILADLGWYYASEDRPALLAPERNNHGHSVLSTLIHELGYPLMEEGWPFGVYLHEEYDAKEGQSLGRPGWPTNVKTRPVALDSLRDAIDLDLIRLRSRKTIGELMSFVKKPGGKSGGEGKSKDDQVLSLAILSAILNWRPKPAPAIAPTALPLTPGMQPYRNLDLS